MPETPPPSRPQLPNRLMARKIMSTLHGFWPSSMLLNCSAFSLWPASRTSPMP